MAETIRAVFIVEVLGRPADHVKQMLEEHVKKIDDMKGVTVASISVSEAKELEQRKDFYTCFAEVEVEAESLLHLVHVIFDYMPASVEIIKPDRVEFSVADATSLLNTLSGRLHSYDEIAKIAKMQTQQLAQKVAEMEKGKGSDEKVVEKKVKKRSSGKKAGKKRK